MLEKSGEFWAGVPYGSRSGRNALLISSLEEFIPPLERSQFVSWLSQNRRWVFDIPEYRDGELSSKWLAVNEVDMARGLWDDLFLPRYTFGLYLHHRLTQLLQTTTAKGILQLSLQPAEVMDIQPIKDLYKVDVAIASINTFLLAKKVILAIGSPTHKAAKYLPAGGVGNDICYVNSMYEPSQDSNIRRICEFLERLENRDYRQVLILGSNASALEAIYSLANSQRAIGLISKFFVLSSSATFPNRISREANRSPYFPRYLTSLIKSKSFTARQILNAMKREVAYANVENINIADIYHDLSKAMIEALNRLSFLEQNKFVLKYGDEIGRLLRRAGTEYLNVVDNLASQGNLEFLKGKLIQYSSSPNGGLECEYIQGEEKQVFSAPIKVVISCIGFPDVTKSSSPLIQNLIRRKICIPTISRRGFTVTKNFEVSKNCYLIGPLVAGNIIGDFRVWHAESCARIISLSKELAEVLAQD